MELRNTFDLDRSQSRRNAVCIHRKLSRIRLDHICISDNPRREGIDICTDRYMGMISFHDDIIELYFEEKKTGAMVYYLHFETFDYEESMNNIRSFFDVLLERVPLHPAPDSQTVQEGMRILICCTSSITSSMYASLLQDKLEPAGVQVEARSYMLLDAEDSQYDLILLAPQIRYALHDLQEQYGRHKVQMISAMDFATGSWSGLPEALTLN